MFFTCLGLDSAAGNDEVWHQQRILATDMPMFTKAHATIFKLTIEILPKTSKDESI